MKQHEHVFVYKPLDDFRVKLKLDAVDNFVNCDINYTYKHNSLDRSSKIDYFLISKNMSNLIVDYHVIDCGLNHSDHFPIAFIFEVDNNNFKLPAGDDSGSCDNKNPLPTEQKFYRWDHGDLKCFYEMSRILLSPIDAELTKILSIQPDNYNTEFLKVRIENLYSQIILALKNYADTNIPKLKYGTLKFWWNQELDKLKSLSVTSYRAWHDANRPKKWNNF